MQVASLYQVDPVSRSTPMATESQPLVGHCQVADLSWGINSLALFVLCNRPTISPVGQRIPSVRDKQKATDSSGIIYR